MANNLKVYKNNEDISGKGVRDTEKILQEHLPDLTSSLINSVVVLGQGLPMRFTNNTPAGRKEVLEQLSKSDYMIEDLKRRIDERQQTLTSLIQEDNNKLISATSKIEVYEKDIEQLKSQLASMSEEEYARLKEEKEKADQSLSSLQQKLEEAKSKYETATTLKAELTEQYNEKQQENTKELYAIKEEGLAKIEELSSSKSEKQSLFYSLQSQANTLKQEIERLDNVSDVCPTCGQKLPDVHKIDTTEKKEELKKLISSYQSAYNDLKAIEDTVQGIKDEYNKRTLARKEELDKELSLIAQKINAVPVREAELYKSNCEQSILQAQKTSNDCKTAIDNFQNKKDQITFSIQDKESTVANLKEEVLYITNDKDNLKLHTDVISKFSTAVKRDFRGYLLSGIISYINTKAKEYCQDIFNTTNIEFCLDGNNISISYNDKQYEALSGGEKQKIDLIIQFSIRDMLSKYLNFSSNVLVLDEITDNMDSVGCDNTINFITKKLSDIDSVFIVSHRADLEIPYDKSLCIIKDENGISNVVQ